MSRSCRLSIRIEQLQTRLCRGIFLSLCIAATLLIHVGALAAAEDIANLTEKLLDADENEFRDLFPKLKERRNAVINRLRTEVDVTFPSVDWPSNQVRERIVQRQANAAVALVKLESPLQVWPLLKHRSDSSLRTLLIHRLAVLQADVETITVHLYEEDDVSIQQALLLCLGEFGEGLPRHERASLIPKLKQMYRDELDAGLHAAVEWLLRRWKEEEWLTRTNGELASDRVERRRKIGEIQQRLGFPSDNAPAQWYINLQGQTMVVIPGPVEFQMGSPENEDGRQPNEIRHRVRIGHSFAIASTAVTVEQFLRFRREHHYDKNQAAVPTCPINLVTWYQAAEFCNWLSKREGISKDQWCYIPDDSDNYTKGMKVAENLGDRTGYRLPTEAEREYACRAGTETAYSFGRWEGPLDQYAWSKRNSDKRSHSVGLLKPNDWGIFDMHGNTYDWCQDRYLNDPTDFDHATKDTAELVDDADNRVLRGGSWTDPGWSIRSASRSDFAPNVPLGNVGFRVARTVKVAK
ncbi:formylglycine-generating enzyme family protein [Schlesneria paludicola]|uniref:formylglycine-generating enzyme family protein n=1 Tax=Schlesneria paludicola TaxID=360056 RepID=UPI00029A1BE9|nr:formylglycine-generating enzyme family protein [Schlesneria paludicola]